MYSNKRLEPLSPEHLMKYNGRAAAPCSPTWLRRRPERRPRALLQVPDSLNSPGAGVARDAAAPDGDTTGAPASTCHERRASTAECAARLHLCLQRGRRGPALAPPRVPPRRAAPPAAARPPRAARRQLTAAPALTLARPPPSLRTARRHPAPPRAAVRSLTPPAEASSRI